MSVFNPLASDCIAESLSQTICSRARKTVAAFLSQFLEAGRPPDHLMEDLASGGQEVRGEQFLDSPQVHYAAARVSTHPPENRLENPSRNPKKSSVGFGERTQQTGNRKMCERRRLLPQCPSRRVGVSLLYT